MPLSEDEQRILHEIEQQFYESDPQFAREVAKTTVYSHAGRNLKWAALGFVVAFAALTFSFTVSLVLAFACFLAMFACAVVFALNLRKMGKAGWKQVSESTRVSNFRSSLGETGQKIRKKFKKEE